MAKRILTVDWQSINGAATKKRVLSLKANVEGFFLCPVTACLHIGFKSNRGLRKHINNSHPWFYYFEEQPVVDRNDAKVHSQQKRKSSTHKMPAFSLQSGTGKEFLEWLQTPCGGGKCAKEAVNIGRRAMKFLMASLGEAEGDCNVKEEYIDCCLGSPAIVINFLKLITEEWQLRSSGALNYLKAAGDLLDFRKAKGVSDDTLRSFTVTEVYIRRGKENLAKKKKIEYARNLDLESLVARNSWATIQEMEQVIPYHTLKYEYVLKKCSADDQRPTISELAFATRFIATFLFLRVKCTRPMSYQYMTVDMVSKAKENGGFIDQTCFKTHANYTFDTLVLTKDVLEILQTYISTVRPLLHPTCEYVVVTTNGRQYTAFGAAMSLLVFQAIGKSIHPTRYRQIIETESAAQLTEKEREIISRDQKHSSQVAKRSYQKQLSRTVAMEGRLCMKKMVGTSAEEHTHAFASSLRNAVDGTYNCVASTSKYTQPGVTDMQQVGHGSNVRADVDPPQHETSCGSLVHVSDVEPEGVVVSTVRTGSNSSEKNLNYTIEEAPQPQAMGIITVEEVEVSGSTTREACTSSTEANVVPNTSARIAQAEADVSSRTTCKESIGNTIDDVEVKREEAADAVSGGLRLKRYTVEEDASLRDGIRKYGSGKWSQILRDSDFTFHPCRNRDSLRMRADTLGISGKSKKKNKAKGCREVI